jgi:hypothetical protein
VDLHLCDLERGSITTMSREQLLEAIRRRPDCLPPDLTQRLDEEPDGWLRLLLLSARINYALRNLRGGAWEAAAPSKQSPPDHRGSPPV